MMNKRVIKDLRQMDKPEVMSLEDARSLAVAKGFSIEPSPETPDTGKQAPIKVDQTSTPTTEEVSPMANTKPKAVADDAVEESSTVEAATSQKESAKATPQTPAAPVEINGDRFKALEAKLAEQSTLISQQTEALKAAQDQAKSAQEKAEQNARVALQMKRRSDTTEQFNSLKSYGHGLMSDGRLTPANYKELFGEDNEQSKSILEDYIKSANGDDVERPSLDNVQFHLDQVSKFEPKAEFSRKGSLNLEKPNFESADFDKAAEDAYKDELIAYAKSRGDKNLLASLGVTEND